MIAEDERHKVAKLYKAERGFGGDNYYYRVTPVREDGAVALVTVGWGLLGRAATMVRFKAKEDTEHVLSEHGFHKEDHTHIPPEVALSILGYVVVGKVHWEEKESQGTVVRHDDEHSDDPERSAAASA